MDDLLCNPSSVHRSIEICNEFSSSNICELTFIVSSIVSLWIHLSSTIRLQVKPEITFKHYVSLELLRTTIIWRISSNRSKEKTRLVIWRIPLRPGISFEETRQMITYLYHCNKPYTNLIYMCRLRVRMVIAGSFSISLCIFSICTCEVLIYSKKVVFSCTNRVLVSFLSLKRNSLSLKSRRIRLIEEKREILIIQSTPLVQRGVLATISSPSYKDVSVFTLNLKFRVLPCTWRPVWRRIEKRSILENNLENKTPLHLRES